MHYNSCAYIYKTCAYAPIIALITIPTHDDNLKTFGIRIVYRINSAQSLSVILFSLLLIYLISV